MSYELIKLNMARSSLKYVIRAFKIKEIYLPYYLCPAIRNAVRKENCEIKFYHIDESFKPCCDFPLNAFILYPDYFGVCADTVNELAIKYENLIVDNAHSFYSEPKGIASFNSLRKFFPMLKDGSFLYTKKTLSEEIQSSDFDYVPKRMSYDELCKNERKLDDENIRLISAASAKYDFSFDRENRIKKVKYFKNLLDDENTLGIEIIPESLPFCYPFLAKDIKRADELVKSLHNETYRYWNNMPDSYVEKIFYTKLVAITL